MMHENTNLAQYSCMCRLDFSELMMQSSSLRFKTQQITDVFLQKVVTLYIVIKRDCVFYEEHKYHILTRSCCHMVKIWKYICFHCVLQWGCELWIQTSPTISWSPGWVEVDETAGNQMYTETVNSCKADLCRHIRIVLCFLPIQCF